MHSIELIIIPLCLNQSHAEEDGSAPSANTDTSKLKEPAEPDVATQAPPAKPAPVPGAGVFPHDEDHQKPSQEVQAPADVVTSANPEPAMQSHEVVGTTTTPVEKEVPGPHSPAPADASFVPTAEWIESWRSSLPIGTALAWKAVSTPLTYIVHTRSGTIIRLLGALVPQLPTLVSGSSTDESQILEYLRNTTLVGLLPVPHPILIRRYQSNAATNLWFTTFMYVYPLPLRFSHRCWH